MRTWLKKEKQILIFILLIAFFLRLWGLKFGLPQIYHTDESYIISKAKMILENKGASMGGSYFGLFHYFIAVLLYFFWIVAGSFLGRFPTPIQIPISDFVLFGRFLSVLVSTTTIFFTFRLGKLLYGRTVGLLASAILAVTFIDVLIAHYFKQDVYIQLFTLLVLYFSVKILLRVKRSDYLFSGFFVALATAFKINSVISVLPFFSAHILSQKKKINLKKILLDHNLIGGMLLVCLGIFSLFVPFYFGLGGLKINLWDIKGVFEVYWAESPQIFASGSNGIPSFAWWPIYLATSGLFYPLFFLCLGGLTLALKKRTQKELVLFFLFFPYCFLLAIKNVRFDRWITLVTPILAILGALFLEHLIRAIKLSRKARGLLVATLLIIIFGVSGGRIILFDYSLSQKDTRQLAQEWLITHYPKDQIIFAIGDTNHIGHFLQKQGFSEVMNLFPLDNKEIFLYPGEILLIDSEDYHVAENYQETNEYREIWENYQLIKKKGKLVKEFSQPLFKAEFFSPSFLEHSSTVNAYHNPTVEIYEIPRIVEYEDVKATFEYHPGIMNHNMRVVKADESIFLFKESEEIGKIFGPHALFPKGQYLLEYYLLEPNCQNKEATITIQVSPSGQEQYFASKKFYCTSLKRYNRLNLKFRLDQPQRLELILEAESGTSFFVEKAILKTTSYE